MALATVIDQGPNTSDQSSYKGETLLPISNNVENKKKKNKISHFSVTTASLVEFFLTMSTFVNAQYMQILHCDIYVKVTIRCFPKSALVDGLQLSKSKQFLFQSHSVCHQQN